MARKKKPDIKTMTVACEYDKARVIELRGFMAPVSGDPGKWVIIVKTWNDKMHPPDDEPEG